MSDVDATQVSGSVSASQPSGVVRASQIAGSVGARVAQPESDLWTPAQLGDDLALWLDVWDSPFDLRTDGDTDFVERWGDLSGGGNDATQGTASEQMRLSGARVISGGPDYMTAPPPSVADTVVFAVLVDVTESEEGYLDISDGSATNTGGLLFHDDNRGFVFRVVSTSGQKDVDSDVQSLGLHIVVGTYDSVELRLRVDGVKESSTLQSGDIAATQSLWVGKLTKTRSRRFFAGGGLLSSIVTSSVFDPLKVEGWLAHKADRNGIPEPLQNLPSDHPYKEAPPRL